jgi:PEGA domain
MKHSAIVFFASTLAFAADIPKKPLAQVLTGQSKIDYESAKLLVQEKQYEPAALKFEAAYEVSHDPRLLLNVAICQRQLQDYPKTLIALRKYLEQGEGYITPSERREGEDLVKTLEPLVSRLLVVSAEPEALVTMDNAELGKTPLAGSTLIKVGKHHIKVTKSGFKPFEQDVNASGEETRVDAKLAPDLHIGTVDIAVKPKGAIYIDGALVGNESYRAPLSSGVHTVRLTSPGLVPYQSDISIQDDQIRTVSITLDKDASKIPGWAWILGGTALVAGAAVGGYFIFHKTVENPPPPGTLDPGVITTWR